MKRHTQTAGIAIVGIGCRFPGANSPAEFWRNLTEGRESVAFASDEELLAAGVDPELFANPDYVRAASRIETPEYFDAAFFGYSLREAEIIDPQQRVFLECAWEALEEAGCDPSEYPGAIGVFAGAGMNTYGILNLLSRPEILASVGSYQAMVGNDKDFLCSRVAYKLNLKGPAVGVQTACSTSLVAVQMAFESLLRKECDVALAGGVSIPLPQPLGYLYQPGMILSRDGHCRAFDAAASGTVPGAGAGVVVLKRLDDAIENGDHIYAVIRGAAINNDGAAKVGYSAPSVDGQHAVIRRSMEMAGFDPASVKYVEAHGTGTEVGDPIEFTALAKAFESAANAPGSCALGSLKTNIGHLDTAAGVAGLIKTALCVKHRILPPTLHFTNANPLIDFAATPFYVNSILVRYSDEQPFRAGVSSFGIGGTNVHLSLEEAPLNDVGPAQGSQLIVLSAKSPIALDRRMSQLLQYLEETPAANLADIAYTLQVGRQRFQYRQALVARDVQHLQEQLRAGLHSGDLKKLRAEDPLLDPPPVAFLFPGQGAQYVNMGRNLYESVPLFREIVDSCAQRLQPLLGLDLRTVLYPAGGDEKQVAERLLGQTSITQPAIFTVEYAMARLWMQCGISPAAMIGHSVGEYVAACLAGVFSLEDALVLIAERGRLIQSMPSGVMLAVSLSEQDLTPLLAPSVSIAAVNSGNQVVASGPDEEIAKLEEVLNRKKILCKRLRTSHAFHSPMMDPIVAPFVERVGKIKLQAPSLRYLSNVSGTWITAAQAVDPPYWGAHLRNTVRFADCARNLSRESDYALLEVGPGETLGSLMRAKAGPVNNNNRTILPSMRHALAPVDDRDHWLAALGKLWLKNIRVDWNGLHSSERRVRVSLPTYPFDRQRYWIEPAKTVAAPSDSAIPLKKAGIADWFYAPSWKRTLAGPAPKNEKASKWLVFAEDDTVSEQLIAKLGTPGNVLQARAGSAYRVVSPNMYELRPQNKDDYRALFRDLIAGAMWPDRIMYLWKPELSDCGVLAAMCLVQALEEESFAAPVEINVIGNRAYSIFGEPISSPAPGALNAFWGVVSLECSNINPRIIDVDFDSDQAAAIAQVMLELRHEAPNEAVAYRGNGRWLQTYEPVRIERSDVQNSDRSLILRQGGTYVITGGLGGVGLVLGRHIARNTQGRIVLLSRTPLPPEGEWKSLIASVTTPNEVKEKIKGVQSIVDAGGQVVTMPVDVSDEAAMGNAMTEIHRRYGTVHGIIHAAGTAAAGMIQVKAREQVLSVLSPKVQGSEWLRKYLPAAELDFVMLCSSISAVLPYFGLSDYVAANAYLDGFAAMFDDPAGTRVIAVNWDTWQDVGMAVHAAMPTALASLREDKLRHAIRSEEAEEVFDRLLELPVSQIVVSTRDLPALQKMNAVLAATIRAAVPQTDDHEQFGQAQDGELPASEDGIEEFIVALWQELLGVNPISVHDNFFQLGGHSLMGTQVLSRVRERFRVNLPLRSVFEAVTPAEFAQRIRVMRWAASPAQADSDTEREEIEI